MRLWDYLKLCLLITMVLAPGTFIIITGHRAQLRLERLAQYGIKGTAKIEGVTVTDHRQNGVHSSYSYELKISYLHPIGGGLHFGPLGITEQSFQRISPDRKMFQKGSEIELLMDPNDPSSYVVAGELGEWRNSNYWLWAIGITFGLALVVVFRGLITEARRSPAARAMFRSTPPPLPR